MINSRKFGLFLSLVHRSGIHETIEARLRPTGAGGRPRDLDIDVFLAAMMATVDDGRPQTISQVHQTLVNLDCDYQVRLGVVRGGRRVPRTRLYYLMSAIEKAFSYTKASAPKDLDESSRVERRDALQDVVDRLLAATTMHLEPATRFAIDATSIESFAKGKRRPGKRLEKGKSDPAPEMNYSADPDAAHGHRTATYGLKNTIFFGYHLTSLVRIAAVGEADSQPLMTDRILLSPANHNDVPDAMEAIDRLLKVHPIVEVIADRGYSNKDVDVWAGPLRKRGIEQVLDMMPSDHGPRTDPAHGFVMLDGWPHDPSVPDHLLRITPPPTFTVEPLRDNPTVEEVLDYERRTAAIAEFDALIAERRLYAYVRHAKGKNGAVRFKCPGAAGKLRTFGCEHSEGFPESLPTSAHPAGIATPTACTAGHTVFQIGGKVQEKLRQRYYWGSPEWKRAYARRGSVERSFAYLKGTSTLNTTRGWTRQVGLVNNFLLLAIRIAVMNMRLLIRWARQTGYTAEPLALIDTKDYGRREVAPPTGTNSDTAPPMAA